MKTFSSENVKKQDLKILFMGTPDFAVPSLEMLLKESFDVVGVVTKEDKPGGRKMTLMSPPVKIFAQENGLKVLQPTSLKSDEFLSDLRTLNPNIIITVAYGKILPINILDFPLYGCLNVHASLLPKYRGASPIQASIRNGDDVSGITYMKMDVGMDTGDIISQVKVILDDEMNAGDLTKILSEIGAKHLAENILNFCNKKAELIKQDDDLATTVKPIQKKDCKIEWDLPAYDVHNHIRSSNPWPGAFTFYNNKRMKISKSNYKPKISQEFKSFLQENHNNLSPGCIIISEDKSRFFVMCRDELIEVSSLQMEGCKNIKSSECAHNFNSFDKLGG